jgi:pimeloyl-ACP methyl ester carboxylesterase
MTKLLLALAFTGCATSSPQDPIDDVPYPACIGDTEQCLDAMPVGGLTMPLYRNVSLTAPNSAITQAVIVVHGASRDANNFFYSMMTAAEQDGVDGTTAVIAPHFECDADSPPAGDMYWACSDRDWAHGYADESGAQISSYAVIDQLVTALADKAVFPALTRVVITGLSAGGQLTERYATTTQIDPLAGVAISYAVLSPSSYAWLDATRPGVNAGCADYNDYSYGLDNRSGYVAVPDHDTAVGQLISRDVAYMVGSEDTLANAAGTDLDTSCQANTQGIDRVERATNFFQSITETYGATQTLTVVPGCMHSRACMYFSPEVRTRVLGSL